MDPVTSSIVTGIGGEILGGLFGSSSAKKQNKAAAAAQERANQFTREQMQNRHQWEVDDLRKAGLNPILSAGGTPSMGGSSAAPVVGELDAAASSAKTLGKMSLERKTAQAALENIQIDNSKKVAETNSTEEMTKFIRSQAALKDVETRLLEKYGPAQAIAGIARDGGSALGSILGGGSSAKNAWRPETRRSESINRNFNDSKSKSESHNWHYKGKK